MRNSPTLKDKGISVSLLFSAILSASCTTTRPCSEAGDVSWASTIKGDRFCEQKRIDGRWVNQGSYIQKYPSGKIALEGSFVGGKKNGLWVEYDEQGNKIRERRYDNGVETSSRE
jgi:hypothetical protein